MVVVGPTATCDMMITDYDILKGALVALIVNFAKQNLRNLSLKGFLILVENLLLGANNADFFR